MQAYPMELTLLPTSLIFLVGFYITFKCTKSLILSFIIPALKSGLYFLYFTFFFNGYFTISDDIRYLEIGKRLYLEGDIWVNLLNLANHTGEMGSRHVTYYILNALSFNSFNRVGYYLPVSINIILTFISAYYMVKILRKKNFGEKNIIFYYVFFVLNIELLSWSTLLNIKDFLVQMLVIIIFYNLVSLREKKIKYIIGILLSTYVLYFTRFYLLFFIIFTVIIIKLYKFCSVFRQKKVMRFLLIVIGLIIIFSYIYLFNYNDLNLLIKNTRNPLIGSARYVLTPIPFHYEPQYSFLVFSSLVNWLLFPFFIIGIVTCFKTKNISKEYLLFVIYLSINVIFYGLFTELQGPRHRIHLLFLFSFFQLIGIKRLKV